MTTEKLAVLTPGDKAIFARAKAENNPNWILNYYLRSPDSGTWWRRVTQKDVDSLILEGSKRAAQRCLRSSARTTRIPATGKA
jgi:hypothetical protein